MKLFSASSSARRSALPKSKCTPDTSGRFSSLLTNSFSFPASLWMKTNALMVGRSVGVV